MRTLRKAAAERAVLTALIIVLSVLAAAGCAAADKEKSASSDFNTDEADARWFYSAFDAEYRAAYTAFDKAADELWSSEPVQIIDGKGKPLTISVKDLDRVYQGFLYDHPAYFWLGRSYSYRVNGSDRDGETADAVLLVPEVDSKKELEERRKIFESSAEKILTAVQKSESEKVRAQQIYDLLADGTEYVEEAAYDEGLLTEHTAYGAIVERRAVCDGFALAYKYLLDQCGIRNTLIPGESEGAPHVWNTVYWDESWHEADLTWDASSAAHDKRQYFDLTTEEMEKDHSRETDGIAGLVPAAGKDAD